MYERPAVVALRDHLAAVVLAHPSVSDEENQWLLQGLVCKVVDEFKTANWPPERVIVAVKQIANDAGLCPSGAVPAAPLTEHDAAIVNLVRWCIEQYYGVT